MLYWIVLIFIRKRMIDERRALAKFESSAMRGRVETPTIFRFTCNLQGESAARENELLRVI